MTKAAKRPKPAPQPEEDDIPPGYLPTADPPRKNVALLAIAAGALVAWMLILVYLIVGAR